MLLERKGLLGLVSFRHSRTQIKGLALLSLLPHRELAHQYTHPVPPTTISESAQMDSEVFRRAWRGTGIFTSY